MTNIQHYGVRKEDWCLQVIEWGGKLFIELRYAAKQNLRHGQNCDHVRMAFGTISSPYYFDTGSDVQKELTCLNIKVKELGK